MSVAPRAGRTTAPRLGLGSLESLPPASAPRVDPRSLGVGIVHLGIGAFHRAHQAVCTEDAIAAGGGEWGICGVTQRSRAVVDQLGPQDGLYTLIVRDGAAERLRVVGSVREVRWAQADAEGLLERIAAPATRVVTLTVSEKGYHHDPATNRLRSDSPEIAADLADGGTRTVLGQLVAGLDRRRHAHGAPVSIVCCDNLPHNGTVLAGLVREFAARRGDERLLGWLAESVRFPATMVDRITPATTGADRAGVAEALGVRDEGAVVTEPFSQWVIEDDFAAERPAWELGGATLTADVRPYEHIKLRMLNGSHSTLAYLGILAGHQFAADAAAPDRPLAALLRRLMMTEVAPTLAVPAGFDLAAYAEDVLRRFANPALRHRLAQICMDGSQKLPQRLLGTIRDRRRAGTEPVIATLGVAAWMRFVSARRSDGGRGLVVEDPLADEIADRLAGREAPEQVVDALLALRQVFDEELAGDAVLRDLLVEHLRRLAGDGAEATVRGMTG